MCIQFTSVKMSPTTLYRFLHCLKVAAISDSSSIFFWIGRLLGINGFTQYFSCTEKQPLTGILQNSHAKTFWKLHRPATLLKKCLHHRFFIGNFVKFLRKVFYIKPISDCFCLLSKRISHLFTKHQTIW